MAFKVFLDANVCLDFLLRRENYPQTKKIFQKIFNEDISSFVTPAIVHIMAFYLAKHYGKKMVKTIILDLLASVRVVDCTHEIAINAVSSRMTDIEDALQYYAAMHHKIDYFISLDKNLIKTAIPVLPVYSPEEFLKEFDND
ncbi:MAG TPA: PIN domain-containing protein [Pedobacter sp.]|jgi:predicted nucleic acid-binding protein